MRNSGQTAKFWTLESRKVVGVPRFELGTPCTPCGGYIHRKSLSRIAKEGRETSRISERYEQLSLCFDRISPSDSGRYFEPGDQAVYHHAEGDRPAIYLGRYGSRHLITIAAHGGQAGRGLRYVEDVDFRPAIDSTAEHP